MWLHRRSQRALALGLAGAALVWAVEIAAGPGQVRNVVADLGWTGFAFGAVVGVTRAAFGTAGRDRGAWLWIFAGTVLWTLGQLFWDVYDIANIVAPTPAPSDIGYIGAGICYLVGCAAFLYREGQRLAIYALALDVSAAVLTMVAAVALYASDVFSAEMVHQPLATTIGLAYPIVYVAATGAALSMFWGLPPSETRRAHVLLLGGITLNAVAFVLWFPDFVHETFVAGTVLDPIWMIGILCVGIAGSEWSSGRDAAGSPLVSGAAVQFSRMILPGLAAVIAAGILVASQLDKQTATDPIVAAVIAILIIVLSARAGLALYANWRLGLRERHRAAQFAALYDVGLATAGEISLAELARLAVDNATQLNQTDGAMIAILDPEQGVYTVRAVNRSKMPALRDSSGETLAGVGRGCVRTHEAVVAVDYAAHPESNPMLHGVIASALALPLIAQGEVLGVMTLYSGRARHWGGETQRMFRLYAAQVAIAIANARLLSESRRLASDDPLTGLTNRRVLVERLEAETAEARRHGDAFCVVLCDVDGLKGVNDTAGHLVGDSVLRSVAATLRASARAEDVVARFGGDEFVLLLPRTSVEAAQALVQRLGRELPEQTYTWGGMPHTLPRVSLGVASFPQDGLLADQLIAKADERMYADKARARGRVR